MHLPRMAALAVFVMLATPVVAADQYIVRVPANVQAAPVSEPTPPAEPLSVSLAGFSLPSGTVGQPYAPFDLFSVLSISEAGYSMSDVNWSLKQGTSLPPGLSLTTEGKISGTPTTKNEGGSEFEVVASYKEVSGQRAYTIVVNGVSPAGWDTPIQGAIVENDFTMAGQGFNAKAAKGLSSDKGQKRFNVSTSNRYRAGESASGISNWAGSSLLWRWMVPTRHRRQRVPMDSVRIQLNHPCKDR